MAALTPLHRGSVTRSGHPPPDATPRARPVRNRIGESARWGAVALTAVALAFPYAAPVILGV